jgi:MFS-type transporter involved in bile tolerance (Atg22 family)
VAFTALGFFLGHVVPLSIDRYGHKQSNLLAVCWAITVTGSVLGTVLASLLARDFGMFAVAVLGILCYLCVVAVTSVGIALTKVASGRAGGRLLWSKKDHSRIYKKKEWGLPAGHWE